ncbi:phage late control D family protein [Hafnia alvei]|uniref:phage late control D family protein n=1 Tax=Hafnia alvei TaxID=569 RepID=UPI000B69117C|nr:phage late control D family protein [Hafnia alvei]MBI0277261.1 phage late control D family protein [Hafnia alvei]PNL03584.1 hypothetical protein CEQ28_023150 [Hafnia alvei]
MNIQIPQIPRYTPKPAFNIELNDKTLTLLDSRLISLTLTDNRGFEADTLELTLDDTDGKLELPPRGALLSVSLGWDSEPLIFKGCYTVDEITHSGPPDQLVITARSADFRDTFNVKRDYSWHDITVGVLITDIASRYQLQAGVSDELADVTIDHADQTGESDISFLTRMADQLGAVATIKNGTLLFILPGQGVSRSGKPLPMITITKASGDGHHFNVSDRDAYTGVSAYWLDLNYGKKKSTTIKSTKTTHSSYSEYHPKKRHVKRVKPPKTPASSSKDGSYLSGADGNVYILKRTYKTENAAKQAAAAKWSQLQRGAASFSITLVRGRADLFPEQPAAVEGFKSVIDGEWWTITKCTHSVSGSGFTTALELEVKISNDNAVSGDGNAAD